jgi:hypothetical protein
VKTHGESKVHRYLDEAPSTRAAIEAVLLDRGDAPDGAALLDEYIDPMIEWVFARITEEVDAESLTQEQAHLFIVELSVFARFNSLFLYRAAASVEGGCFELAHELRRNHLEEGGERGKLPAHYVLYSGALLSDLGILVNGWVPAPETQTLLLLHDLLVSSHSPSTICGAYYATEGVAIAETILLRSITDRYGQLAGGRTGADLPRLQYYFDLHLNEAHEGASRGVSVEASHADGIGNFIRQSEVFNLKLPEICDGFLQIMEAMANWWTVLARRAREGRFA